MLTSGPEDAKVIRKFKIALTSACTLRCVYCFVDKDAGEVVDEAAARSALELFIGSAGAVKKLELYGGEPLLRFDAARRLLEFAFDEAARRGKRLTASLATNGVLVGGEAVAYLAAQDVHVSVSFSGTGAVHDRLRPFPNGRGSFDRVRANLPRLFAGLGGSRVDAILCVHPDGAATLAEDFERLLDIGFEHVNLEVVHGFPWPAGARAAFSRGLEGVGRLVLRRIAAGRPVFIDSFFDFLDPELRRRQACPFYRDLELYPTGEYSFYPYPFVPAADRARVAVGRAPGGLSPRWAECRFEEGGERCRACRGGYYTLPGPSEGNEPYRERTRALGALLREILDRAGREPRFDGYARELMSRSAGGIR